MTYGDYWLEQKVFDALKVAISSGTPSDGFLAYLKDFQLDKPTTGRMDKPPSFNSQSLGIRVVILRQLRSGQGSQQVIKQSDISSTRPAPYFFTTLATMFYVLHEIEVTNNIGYEPMVVEAGIRAVTKGGYKGGYAEIVVGDELVQKLTTPLPEKITSSTIAAPGEHVTAEIHMPKNIIYMQLSTGEKYLVKELGNDRAPHAYMSYVMNHHDTDIPRGTIQTKVDGCATKKDMTELAKQCGFTKKLHPFKRVFFTGTTRTKARFTKTATLTSEQIELLKRVAKQIA